MSEGYAVKVRPEKVEVVDRIKSEVEATQALVLTEYRGLTVNALKDLRAKLLTIKVGRSQAYYLESWRAFFNFCKRAGEPLEEIPTAGIPIDRKRRSWVRRRAFSVASATASADQSVASTRPPANAAAIDGSASPHPSSSTRAPRSARPAIARASARPLGHSSTQ